MSFFDENPDFRINISLNLYIGSIMSLASGLTCTSCGKEYDLKAHLASCLDCNGVIQVTYDLEGIELKKKELSNRRPGVWKYFELLPVKHTSNIVTLGEGGTYLHNCERLSTDTKLDNLYLKDETKSPTGAFIDRGTTVEISFARELGFRNVSCGWTGNLAASMVAYAARAGLESRVFIGQKERVDLGKLHQILAFATDVDIVRNREEARMMAMQVGANCHTMMPHSPYFLEGIKTTVFEVCEQLDWTPPDWMIVPMGNGGHLSMIWKGFKELQQVGLIENSKMRLVGTQAEGCAPIVNAFEKESREILPVSKASTIAIDISVKEPLCGQTALAALRESGGKAIAVSDNEILKAVGKLAKLEGVFAEPASATTIAALDKLVNSGLIKRSDRVVCIITGMGLKVPQIAKDLIKGKSNLEHLLSTVEDRKYTTKLGSTKIHILQILSEQESYGYEIQQKLSEIYGVNLKIPSIYQHLSELTSSGLIVKTKLYDKPAPGRQRQYYDLTDNGKWTLKQLQKIAS